MVGRDARHSARRCVARGAARDERGAARTWVALLLVLVLGGGGAAAYDLGWVDHFRVRWTAPAPVPEPEGLDLPDLAAPRPVAAAVAPVPLAPRKVRRALAGPLGDEDLGRHVLAAVAPAGGGAPVFVRGSGTVVPASTTKLLTATAALSVLGPDHVFATRVVSGGPDTIVLVGGGDPLLAAEPADPADPLYPARADVVTLAAATAAALTQQGRTQVRLGYDDSLFTGPAVNPAWEPDYVPDGVVSPITALWVDQGRPAEGFGRVRDPARAAASAFADALRAVGITVLGKPAHGTAGAAGAELARVESAPLREIVEHVVAVSDNEGSEVLTRHVGLAVSGEGSSAAGVRDTMATLAGLGVDVAGSTVHDGSGLSRQGALTMSTLLTTLQVATSPAHPELAPVVAGLPVAGFSGSLSERFEEGAPAGPGRVRAKTGTLSGVGSLAGIATGVDGSTMVFVVAADRIALPDTLEARDALDRAAAALGACRCAR